MTRSFIALILFASLSLAQTPAAKPASFEVASVKPAGPLDPQKIMSGQQKLGMEVDKAQVNLPSVALNDLILIAFKLKPYQVSGPSWLASGITADRFEVHAKIPDGVSPDQVPEMLQGLLAERFGLKFHWEKTEHSAYALVVGKGGPKMKDAVPDETLDAQNAAAAAKPASGPSMIVNGSQVKMEGNPQQGGMVIRSPGMGPMKMTMSGGAMHFENPKMNMETLTTMLSRFVDRPIVDMTDLKGFYQVAFDVSLEEMMSAARAMGAGPMMAARPGAAVAGAVPGVAGGAGDQASEPGGSIFQSVQQMGLKLEGRKVPLDKLVIDHLEKAPTEN